MNGNDGPRIDSRESCQEFLEGQPHRKAFESVGNPGWVSLGGEGWRDWVRAAESEACGRGRPGW